MGRKRKTDTHLPRRMYVKHGAYYFIDRKGAWRNLGKTYSGALKQYAALIDTKAGTGTIGALVDKYTDEVLPKRSERTREARAQEFKRIRKSFGHMVPTDLKPSDAWEYFETAGGTQQARHEIAALSAVMGWAVKWGVLDRHPLLKIGFPTFKPRTRYIEDAEFMAVRAIATPMVACAMDFALITGARQQNVLGAERRHIKDKKILIQSGKTGKRQWLPMSDDLEATVARALAIGPQLRQFIIATRGGTRYSIDGFQSNWQRLMKKAVDAKLIETPFTFHDIRAKSLSDAPTLEAARARAQHADPQITQHVYRRLPELATVMSIGHLKVK